MEDHRYKGIGIRISSDPDDTHLQAKPDTVTPREALRIPLRLLLVSDLTPQAPVADWSGPSRVRRVDKYRFADLMQEWAPRLSIEVPNHISERPKGLDVALSFPDLKAFHPEQLARQVPMLAELLDIRTLVAEVQRGKIAPATFRTRMQDTGADPEWAEQLYQTLMVPPRPATPPKPASPKAPPSKVPPPKTSHDDPLAGLLSMVDLDGEEHDTDPGPGTKATDLASELSRALLGTTPAQPRVEKKAADLLLADLDGVLGLQVDAILNHPAVRRLEAAWRGLKFLVDRLNFRENILLEVLPAPKLDLDQALYHQVLMPEHESSDHPPLSAVILDFAFDHGQQDVAQLADLAETGTSLQAPIIASAGPAFFDVDQVEGLAKLPELLPHFERPEYVEWHALRRRDAANHIVLALPPFLLRYPYGPDAPVGAFALEETGHLWGGGALAVAAVMAASFARTGWPTHLTGPADEGLEDLPVWRSHAGAIPLAAPITDRKREELAEAGFTVLGCRSNHNSAYLAHAPTVRRPAVYDQPEATNEARIYATLAGQLFAARVAHCLITVQRELKPGLPLAQAQAEITSRLRSFLRASGHAVPDEAVSVEHVADAALPGRELLAVRLRPPASVLPEPVNLVLRLTVPRAN